jgi:hypothetical protein
MGYEYYVGQKLYMVKDVDGKGKGKIVTVAKLTNDGGIDYIMTDGTWGWEREAYNYLGMFPPSARFWNVIWAEEGTFRPVGGAAQRRAYGLEEYKIWWDHRVKKLTTEAKSPEQKVNILNAFQKLFMDVDAQTLRKAGYIHEDSTLTDEGSDALNAILVKDNKVEFVNAAQAKLDEIEKADKK